MSTLEQPAWLILENAIPPRRVDLASKRATIGRDRACDLVLPERAISRVHCILEYGPRGWTISDSESLNGTRVNGDSVQSQPLKHGDLITLGLQRPQRIRFHCAPAMVLDGQESAGAQSILATFHASKSSPRTGDTQRFLQLMNEILLSNEALEPTLQRIVDLARRATSADRSALCLHEASSGSLRPLVSSQRSHLDEPIVISRTLANVVLQESQAVLVQDPQGDPRLAASETLDVGRIGMALGAPLLAGGRNLGMLYLDATSKTALRREQLEPMSSLATFAAVLLRQDELSRALDTERQQRARLSRYFSPGVAQRIVETKADESLEVDEREVTVLFADLSGFTSISERLAPSVVAALLNDLFDRFTKAIFEEDGTLDKFLGDAVMAVFGAPLPQPDHAQRSLRVANDIVQSLKAWAPPPEVPTLSVRIGIYSGRVVAGDLGSPARMEYTVIGDTVNLASRLQSEIAEPGEIIVGARTAELAGTEFPLEELGPRPVRGRRDPVQVFRLTSTSTDDDSA